MSNNIEPKVVVITGASVAMGARRADRLQSLAKELNSSGAKVLAVTTDVIQPDRCSQRCDCPQSPAQCCTDWRSHKDRILRWGCS